MGNSSEFYQKGQTLLIVVLVMVVALTIGLSVVSRSITNVRTTTEEANSAQALAAAEAGVAQAIQTNQGVTSAISYGNNASFTSTVDSLSGQTIVLLNGGSIVPQDEGADLWLVPHNSDGTPNYTTPGPWSGTSMTIYWGDTAHCPEQAALEVLLIKGSSGDPKSQRFALDPCSARSTGAAGNNFTNPSSGSYSIGGRTFSYSYNLNPNTGLIARIIPIYKNAFIAVESVGAGAPAFPSQGSMITATGKAADTTIQRKLNVFQGFSYLPIEYVTYGIFSPR
ncbi:MAG: hypothetical protein AAB521_02630 [Patescibacteria group bacterium]